MSGARMEWNGKRIGMKVTICKEVRTSKGHVVWLVTMVKCLYFCFVLFVLLIVVCVCKAHCGS